MKQQRLHLRRLLHPLQVDDDWKIKVLDPQQAAIVDAHGKRAGGGIQGERRIQQQQLFSGSGRGRHSPQPERSRREAL